MLVGRPSDPRESRWTTRALALGLLTLGLGACTETPSYLLEWTVVDVDELDQPPELSSVKQCSEVGVSKVRVTTKRGDAVVDVREYPCFPGASVEGPALEPGDYTLELEGLRRSGEPWTPDEDEPADPRVAYDTGSVTIGEGTLPTVDFVLVAPPQCDDGIDNDLDGKVDGKDPACILDALARESGDANIALFQTTVTFLDSSVVKPANVGVNAIVFDTDGAALEGVTDRSVIPHSDLDLSQWPFAIPLITKGFPAGSYTTSVFAARETRLPNSSCNTCGELTQRCGDCHECDGDPDPIACVANSAKDDPSFECTDYDLCLACVPCEIVIDQLTEPFLGDFTVDEDQAVFQLWRFDFSAASFLTQIVEPLRVLTNLNKSEGQIGQCDLDGYLGGSLVSIDQLWFRVSDVSDEDNPLFLDTVALNLSVDAVDEAEGWISFACPSKAVVTDPLPWGAYRIEIQARIGASVCFETDEPQDLAPQPSGSQDFYLDRVFEGNPKTPPAECRECTQDSHCHPKVCVDGLCLTKCLDEDPSCG